MRTACVVGESPSKVAGGNISQIEKHSIADRLLLSTSKFVLSPRRCFKGLCTGLLVHDVGSEN